MVTGTPCISSKYKSTQYQIFNAAWLILPLAIAACSGSKPTPSSQTGSVNVAPTPTPSPIPTPSPTPAPAPAGLINVSATIADVPSWAMQGRTANYVGHDPRYPLKTAWGECLAMSARGSSLAARCEIRSFRLIEFSSTRPAASEAGTVVGDAEFSRHSPADGQSIRCDLEPSAGGNFRLPNGGYCVGANFNRAICPAGGGPCTLNFYADSDPSDGSAGSFFPGTNMIVRDGVLVIDAGAWPDKVGHWWTVSPDPPFTAQQDWRAPSSPGRHYLVEIEFRIIGAAALRVGLDRWTAGGATHVGECSWTGTTDPHGNCEDYSSDWYQTQSESWVRVRLPLF
jgi:hypothetical protein